MLLACSVDTPIHINRSHLLALRWVSCPASCVDWALLCLCCYDDTLLCHRARCFVAMTTRCFVTMTARCYVTGRGEQLKKRRRLRLNRRRRNRASTSRSSSRSAAPATKVNKKQCGDAVGATSSKFCDHDYPPPRPGTSLAWWVKPSYRTAKRVGRRRSVIRWLAW